MDRMLGREAVKSREFALVELCIVVISGAVLCWYPHLGAWAISVSLLPWGLRYIAGESPFRHRTYFDFFIVVFLLTAVSGYWASYNQIVALHKLYLIVMSILLYYALSAQPEANLVWVSALFFCLGVGIALYFLLTQDFVGAPRKLELMNQIGRWLMLVRPSVSWAQIHPNYASGLAAITMPFGMYLAQQAKSRKIFAWIGIGLILQTSVVFLATSRGVWMALIFAVGMWGMWKIFNSSRIKSQVGSDAIFPLIVIISIVFIVALLYASPISIGGSVASQGKYGSGTRSELFWRSTYLVSDFPITGGGLGAFPGLYSQYILGIPNYYLPNAHNTFLDVFIEQGIFGGVAYLTLFLFSIWLISRKLSNNQTVFNHALFIALLIAFVHGLVDDYLYNSSGVFLALSLVGVSAQRFNVVSTFGFQKHSARMNIVILAILSVPVIGLFLVYSQSLRSVWFSNLGAVQMAKEELNGFPTDRWAEPAILEGLQDAEASLRFSIAADPANRTANHRLGLIAMLQRDFPLAEEYLSASHQQSPAHRGITKMFGYCLAWLGNLNDAVSLLKATPEAGNELEVYIWWWNEQGRKDLSERAVMMKSLMDTSVTQP